MNTRQEEINNDVQQFPQCFYFSNGKNFRISQIVNKWVFGRKTPDGNEVVGVEIPYLEHAYGNKHYVVNKIYR